MTFFITTMGVIVYIYISIKSLDLSIFWLIVRSCELYTTSVPPILPLCLNLGLEYAVSSLKEKKIKSLLMRKINQAGRIKVMCFDKTGTLTENDLYFEGFVSIHKN